eukprot:1158053-Rhodomonas_salina.1
MCCWLEQHTGMTGHAGRPGGRGVLGSQPLPSGRGQGRVSWRRGGEGKGILFDGQGGGRSRERESGGVRVRETEG